jgi:6-pyruvoyltetrahydropterin/6-carboxytetrahydropterin synthase
MKYSVTKRFTFEAAHHLPYHKGLCQRVHGHGFKLEITVSNTHLQDTGSDKGLVIDFRNLSQLVSIWILSCLDHEDLNKLFENPTAEEMSVWIYETIKVRLPRDITLEKVKLWETEDNFVEITE